MIQTFTFSAAPPGNSISRRWFVAVDDRAAHQELTAPGFCYVNDAGLSPGVHRLRVSELQVYPSPILPRFIVVKDVPFMVQGIQQQPPAQNVPPRNVPPGQLQQQQESPTAGPIAPVIIYVVAVVLIAIVKYYSEGQA